MEWLRYRNRNNVAHKEAVMCVVVQEMVDPAVAGTAFRFPQRVSNTVLWRSFAQQYGG